MKEKQLIIKILEETLSFFSCKPAIDTQPSSPGRVLQIRGDERGVMPLQQPLSDLSDAEVCSLCGLTVAAFFEVLMNEDFEGYESKMREAVGKIAEEVRARAEKKTNEINETRKEEKGKETEKLAMFSHALHELKRTGVWGDAANRLMERTDREVVGRVTGCIGRGDNWRMEHAAMDILMKEPLGRVVSEGMGKRRREYAVGGEFFEKTLRGWAETIGKDGKWEEGVGKEEAMSRICLFEKDFGSVEGVDNREIMERGYDAYAGKEATGTLSLSDAVSAMEDEYYALMHQWSRGAGKEEIRKITIEAETLLEKTESALKGADVGALQDTPRNTATLTDLTGAELRSARLKIKTLLLRSADNILYGEEEEPE